jgi:hypothetical protein
MHVMMNVCPLNPYFRKNIVACTALLFNDREMGGYTRPFLGNGSVNTFPEQRIRMHQRNGVFYPVRGKEL